MKFLVLLTILFVFSCSAKKEEEAQKVAVKKEQVVNPVDIDDKFMKNYFKLQDELAKDKNKATKDLILAMKEALANINYGKKENILSVLNEIEKANSISETRKSFEVLSNLSYDYVKEKGLNADVYLMYCPMAFNNKGASWLQNNKYLLNPYYGSKMLRCGKIKETLAVK